MKDATAHMPCRRAVVALLAVCPIWALAQAAKGEHAGQVPCGSAGAKLEFTFDGQQGFATGTADARYKSFSGLAPVVPCPKNAVAAGGRIASLAIPRIDFESGTDADRDAKIIAESANSKNQILEFSLKNGYAKGWSGKPAKGRVQMDVYGNTGAQQLAVSVRMKFPDDMSKLKQFPGKIDWLTISEWWNNAAWTKEAFPFRISVNVTKPNASPGSPLRLAVHAQSANDKGRWETTWWQNTNETFDFPVGKWVRLQYLVQEGRGKDGRFKLEATVEGAAPVTVFDIAATTVDPGNDRLDGFSHFNPIKLYTSSKVIDFLQTQPTGLRVWWDDLSISASP